MAEPRYQPAPRSRPSPYGNRPQRSRRAPKQAAPGPVAPWEQDPVVEAPVTSPVQSQPSPQPDAPKPWESDPVVEAPKDPTFYEQYVAPVGQAISDTGAAIKDYVVGKEDPRFGKLPSIDEPDTAADAGLQFGDLNTAKVVGFSDEQYRDIIRKQLGDRFIKEEKDANGFIVLTYRGADGQTRQAYVNKPGLDYEDVDRGVNAALPFLAAGGVAGRVTQGLPIFARATGQAVAGGAASAGQDVAAQGMGSEQSIDPLKAGLAAGGGFAGEYIGAIVGNLVRRWQTDKSLVDASGNLTALGRRLVEKEGFDPDLVQGELAKEFARLSARSNDPAEALVKAQTEQFGIPSTKAQRTKDPQLLLTEKDIRAGTLGREAKERLTDFDRTQADAIENAVRGSRRTIDADTLAQSPINEVGVGRAIAPHRTFIDQDQAVLGEGIQEGFSKAVEKARNVENLAWRKTGNITARAGATRTLPDNVKAALSGRRIQRDLQPTSAVMIDELRAFMDGKAPQGEFSEFVGQQAVTTLDEMRRVMLGYLRNASSQNGDKALAGKIYKGFNDWLADIEANGLIAGDVAGVSKMREAMDVTKYVRGLIKPTDNMGRKTQTARLFEQIENASSGEEVVTALLGASGPKGSVTKGRVQLLSTYKKVLDQFGGDLGKQAWNDVRLAYWLKLVQGKNGELLGPQAMKTAIQTAMNNQKSVFNTLYNGRERVEMRKLVDALKAITYKDPNPSGTGTAVRSLVPNLVAEGLDTQAKRELFSKHNVLMSRIYRAMAKTVRTPVKTDSFAVNRAVSQKVTPKPPPSLGGYASTGLSNALAERREQQQQQRSR